MKRVVSGWIVGCLILIMAGCWDTQDITNRAYITMVGIDRGETDPDSYKITCEIVLPNRLRQQEHNVKASLVETVEAPSIGGAMERLQSRISRPLTLAHIRVVLIGEQLAKEKNFLDIADFFKRNPDIQMRIRLMFVHNAEAGEILKLNPIYEQYMAKELVTMSEVNLPQARVNSFFDFVNCLRSHDGRGFIDRILVSAGDSMLIHHGGAVYDQWRLLGWLSSEETRNANWLFNESNFIVDTREGDSLYTYQADRKTVQITPVQEAGAVRFTVKVKTDGFLMEQQGNHVDMTDPKAIQHLEALFADTIRDQIKSAVQKAQKDFRVDYLGFDSILQENDPKAYERLNWQEIFPELPITVNVTVKITRFGLSR